MPGICGIISRGKDRRGYYEVKRMLECMRHEEYYSCGQITVNELGIDAGWTTIKNSFSDCMPVWNEKKDMGLVIAGEDFQKEETFEMLKIQGHSFRKFDASYLIHLYEEGERFFFENINGWMSGLIIDLFRGKIILFVGRFGMPKMFLFFRRKQKQY
jgi:asparagine synthetase B (glutamine-hydrolysing)